MADNLHTKARKEKRMGFQKKPARRVNSGKSEVGKKKWSWHLDSF